MDIGISSSCFYPLETEKSLIKLGELGVNTTEVFFNSPSELEKSFLKELCEIKNYYGMEIVSFHPYMSFAEGFYIYSKYKRRFYDSLEMYKPMFNAAAQIGAKYFITHGSKAPLEISNEEYAERVHLFNKTAGEFGITVAHENVVYYASQTPQFMAFMKKTLGNEFKAVLDVKQARRAAQNPFEFIDVLKESIVHLHLSDCSLNEDCLPPSEKGSFNFKQLFDKMDEIGYNGKALIEVYRRNFNEDEDLKNSMLYLQSMLK